MLHDVRNWAHAFVRGLRDLGYSFIIRADAMDAVDVAVFLFSSCTGCSTVEGFACVP